MVSEVHPLFGRLLPATAFKRWRGELLLVVVLPDGSPGTLPAAATDVFGVLDEAEVPVTAVLSLDGVRRLRLLLEALEPRSRSRKVRRERK